MYPDEVIDDYQGHPIRLPGERWGHIIHDRPYMVDMQPELSETLKDPEIIRKSTNDTDTVRLYYKWFDDTVVGNKWVCVVAKFSDAGDAFVLTAYPSDRLKPGEEIWRKENR